MKKQTKELIELNNQYKNEIDNLKSNIENKDKIINDLN